MPFFQCPHGESGPDMHDDPINQDFADDEERRGSEEFYELHKTTATSKREPTRGDNET